MPAAAKLTFIPDLVEEHFDELQFLWGQRRRALRSSAYRARELAILEERLEARAEAMLVVGERLLDIVEAALTDGDDLASFAAAFVLLRLGQPLGLTRVF